MKEKLLKSIAREKKRATPRQAAMLASVEVTITNHFKNPIL